MRKVKLSEISQEMMNLTEDWSSGKDISKHHKLICKRIAELNTQIFSIPEEEADSEESHILIKLCHQFYVLKDQSDNQ